MFSGGINAINNKIVGAINQDLKTFGIDVSPEVIKKAVGDVFTLNPEIQLNTTATNANQGVGRFGSARSYTERLSNDFRIKVVAQIIENLAKDNKPDVAGQVWNPIAEQIRKNESVA